MKNENMGFILQQKNDLKRMETAKPISELLESKSGANNKMQLAPNNEGDSPEQFIGIGEVIKKAPWILETRTNEFGRMEARWGPSKHDWMVQIPAGEFLMGEKGKQHKVILTKDFYLGRYPMTQKQWVSVMGNNPSHFKGDDLPVERVSWNDVKTYITKLNKLAGKGRYRLPTEAEWEYACRAGSMGRYCFGDDESQLDEYAWYYNNSGGQTHPVGQKKPNDWGLYDVHGNVWEWVSDWYGEYPSGPVTDPSGPTSGSSRVLRGGSWSDYYSSWHLQVSLRFYGIVPSSSGVGVGFRCAHD